MGCGERVAASRRDLRSDVASLRVANRDDELVAAEARQHRVGMVRRERRQRLRETARDGQQHRVADRVAEGVVDALEVVQVEIDDRDATRCARSAASNIEPSRSMQRCRFGSPVRVS